MHTILCILIEISTMRENKDGKKSEGNYSSYALNEKIYFSSRRKLAPKSKFAAKYE